MKLKIVSTHCLTQWNGKWKDFLLVLSSIFAASKPSEWILMIYLEVMESIPTFFWKENGVSFLILHMQMIHKFYLGMGPFMYHVSSFLGFWGSFPCTSRKNVFSTENKQNLSSFNPPSPISAYLRNIWMVPMYVCISRKFDIGVFSFMSIIAYIPLRRPKVAILEWPIPLSYYGRFQNPVANSSNL